MGCDLLAPVFGRYQSDWTPNRLLFGFDDGHPPAVTRTGTAGVSTASPWATASVPVMTLLVRIARVRGA